MIVYIFEIDLYVVNQNNPSFYTLCMSYFSVPNAWALKYTHVFHKCIALTTVIDKLFIKMRVDV